MICDSPTATTMAKEDVRKMVHELVASWGVYFWKRGAEEATFGR